MQPKLNLEGRVKELYLYEPGDFMRNDLTKGRVSVWDLEHGMSVQTPNGSVFSGRAFINMDTFTEVPPGDGWTMIYCQFLGIAGFFKEYVL